MFRFLTSFHAFGASYNQNTLFMRTIRGFLASSGHP